MTFKPSRELADVQFEDFPPGDDLWWLRWFDYDGAGGGVAGSAMIHITFSRLWPHIRLDDLPVLDRSLASERREQCSARLQAGWLPVITIGLVARGGRVVGKLRETRKRFAFSARTHGEHIEDLLPRSVPMVARVGTGQRSPSPPGGSPPQRTMPNLLSNLSYPMWRAKDGRLLSIRGGRPDDQHLILPCPEVFRVAYAPHRLLALALLGGPWELTAAKVIDLEETEVVDDGANDPSWRVGTAEGLLPEHAVVAANLWLGARGRTAANRLWAGIHGTADRGGVIAATLPFEWDTLEIEAAVIPLSQRPGVSGPLWFGYAITSVRWPNAPYGPPARIEWTPRTRSASHGSSEKPVSLGHRNEVVDTDHDATSLNAPHGMDPAPKSGIVDIDGDGAVWSNAPEVVRLKPDPSKEVGPRRRRASVASTAQVSAGSTARGSTSAATAQPRAVDRFGGGGSACDRFELVIAMLDRLVEQGSIGSHDEVAAPTTWATLRGDRSAWAFPDNPAVTDKGHERWYVRDFGRKALGTADVRRTAMVRSILVDEGLLHLIEIEPRTPTDRFHSLLFQQAGTLRLEAVVSRLLRGAAITRGVWTKTLHSMKGAVEAGEIGHVAIWRHSTLIENPEKPAPRRSLDGARLLAAIRSLAPLGLD